MPTRRATLFGSVVGVYRAETLEGVTHVTHCLEDDIGDVTQALRVRKSAAGHRPLQVPLHFDDVRPDEPRFLKSEGLNMDLGGLLKSLEAAKEARDAKIMAAVKARKDKEAAALEAERETRLAKGGPARRRVSSVLIVSSDSDSPMECVTNEPRVKAAATSARFRPFDQPPVFFSFSARCRCAVQDPQQRPSPCASSSPCLPAVGRAPSPRSTSSS